VGTRCFYRVPQCQTRRSSPRIPPVKRSVERGPVEVNANICRSCTPPVQSPPVHSPLATLLFALAADSGRVPAVELLAGAKGSHNLGPRP
jgi:hypothetical protein